VKRLIISLACLLPLLSVPVTAVPNDLAVTGLVEHELHVTQVELAQMPTVHVKATDHDKLQHDFEGVPLQSLLARAGIASGKQLRGAHMRDYLLASAQDGYAVVFSMAEIDPGLADAQVLVVFKQDGKPLPEGQGPIRLVVPGDKRPARWIRMLRSLTVLASPKAKP
jgi:DMSO/TMAO reductase YedYZ molybdopterin-dependent catalytic subunit